MWFLYQHAMTGTSEDSSGIQVMVSARKRLVHIQWTIVASSTAVQMLLQSVMEKNMR